MSSESLHEERTALKPLTLDMHRAIASLMEELEAVDWYAQRVDAAEDAELRDILAHNRDEEKEHAAMILEWIRRRDPGFDEHLRTYLFTEGSVTELEEAETGGEAGGDASAAAAGSGSLGIGSLREKGGQ
ncbi:MAG: ferritin [Alphaproteobacteria bacterium]|jgi:ferritin-like protein|nr:ferritin [Alphaproteobacteria bacterium]